jgi:cytosine/adenosine deaminase-related metal-dependent hydrolase
MSNSMRTTSAGLPSEGQFVLEVGVVLGPEGPLEQSAVAVDGERFVAVGPLETMPALYRGFPHVRRLDLALVPGFVDCHNHVTQSFAKALTCGEPSQLWRRLWAPLRVAMSPDDIYLATKWAGVELLRGGFTTVVVAGEQAGENSAAAMRALDEIGLRSVFAYGFADSADASMRSSALPLPTSRSEMPPPWRSRTMVRAKRGNRRKWPP